MIGWIRRAVFAFLPSEGQKNEAEDLLPWLFLKLQVQNSLTAQLKGQDAVLTHDGVRLILSTVPTNAFSFGNLHPQSEDNVVALPNLL